MAAPGPRVTDRAKNAGLVALTVIVLAGALYAIKGGGEVTSTPAANAAAEAVPTESPTPVRLGAVALGDSITQMDADAPAKVLGHSWFAGLVRADPHLQYLWNAGVRGDTTTSMAARLNADVLSRHPQVLFVMGGTNDIGKVPLTTTIANLRAIEERSKAGGVQTVILCQIPPRGDATYAGRITKLNAAIVRLGAEKRDQVLDLYSLLATPNGVYRSGYSTDGTHPTQTVQALMAAAAQKQLAAIGL